MMVMVLVHDDVIRWKHFPRYWPFVRRIHFDVFFDLRLKKRLGKQSSRHCAHYDVTEMGAVLFISCPVCLFSHPVAHPSANIIPARHFVVVKVTGLDRIAVISDTV